MKAFGIYLLIILLFAGAYSIELFGWFVSGNLTIALVAIIAVLLLVFKLMINARTRDEEDNENRK